MACDLCGKTGTRLNDLLGIYKLDDVQVICPDCESTINKQLNKIKDVTLKLNINLFKRFLRVFKELNT